jgi:methionine synthase I (cobalamin-dependent)
LDKNIDDLLIETYFDLMGGRNPYLILKKDFQKHSVEQAISSHNKEKNDSKTPKNGDDLND